MRVPRVSLCACIYGGALAGVTKHVRASCVHAWGMGGAGGEGAGVSRRACVWGGLVCLGVRGEVGELVLVCLRFNTMYWICGRIWLGTVSRCQAFYSE